MSSDPSLSRSWIIYTRVSQPFRTAGQTRGVGLICGLDLEHEVGLWAQSSVGSVPGLSLAHSTSFQIGSINLALALALYTLDWAYCSDPMCWPYLVHKMLSSGSRAWKYGSGGVLAALIAISPPPPNFWTCGEPCKPDDTVLRGRSVQWVRG